MCVCARAHRVCHASRALSVCVAVRMRGCAASSGSFCVFCGAQRGVHRAGEGELPPRFCAPSSLGRRGAPTVRPGTRVPVSGTGLRRGRGRRVACGCAARNPLCLGFGSFSPCALPGRCARCWWSRCAPALPRPSRPQQAQVCSCRGRCALCLCFGRAARMHARAAAPRETRARRLHPTADGAGSGSCSLLSARRARQAPARQLTRPHPHTPTTGAPRHLFQASGPPERRSATCARPVRGARRARSQRSR